jgi:hypothetical protein
MAELAVQKLKVDGTKLTFVEADTNGDFFVNDGETYLHVKNTHATLQATVTIYAKSPCNHGELHNIVLSVPATEERQFGPFPVSRFNDLYRKVEVYCTNAMSVDLAAVKL